MKLRASFPVEIYISEPGYICIQSTRFDEEYTVVLSPYQANLVAKEIRALMKDALHTWNAGIEPESDEILDKD